MAANPSIGRAGTAAGELYDRHHRRVHAFCLSQLRDGEDAAEATQTTFVNALGALRAGVTPRLELPWLLAIARNVCLKHWDARRRRRRLELAVDPQDLAELAPAPPQTDLLDGVGAALAALPELQRHAVVLRDWQGLSYKEVAAELGVTLAAAEALIFRGRAALARELAGDETPERRRSGLGSLLGLLKTGTLGAAPAAKLAAGAVAVVCAGAVGTHELAHRSAPASAKPRVAAAVRRTAPVASSVPLRRVVHLPAGSPAAPAARTAHRRARADAAPIARRDRTGPGTGFNVCTAGTGAPACPRAARSHSRVGAGGAAAAERSASCSRDSRSDPDGADARARTWAGRRPHRPIAGRGGSAGAGGHGGRRRARRHDGDGGGASGCPGRHHGHADGHAGRHARDRRGATVAPVVTTVTGALPPIHLP